jgi:hypothetical protein
MSAQLYLARLIDQGRYDRGPNAVTWRSERLTDRQLRRIHRAREDRKH